MVRRRPHGAEFMRGVKYEYVDVDKDEQASNNVIEINEKLGKGRNRSIPVIIINGEAVLSEPSNEELDEALKTTSSQALQE